MSDASDLQKCIQNRIAALSVKDLKRPSMSIQQFVHEYGTTISQASVDKSALISAGFIWENPIRSTSRNACIIAW
jgi:hypothetical protein